MSRRRVYKNPVADVVAASLAPYVVGGVVLWLLYKKLYGEGATALIPAKIEEVKVAAGEIKAGLPGYVADKLMGRNDSTYITSAQQAAMAQIELAKKQAEKNATAGGISPWLYAGQS